VQGSAYRVLQADFAASGFLLSYDGRARRFVIRRHRDSGPVAGEFASMDAARAWLADHEQARRR